MTLGMPIIDNDFVIPALTPTTILSSVCPSEATRRLTHPIYVYDFYPHMHLFGYELYTEHWRCGKKIGEIGRIDSYEFDNQQAYPFRVPIKVLPVSMNAPRQAPFDSASFFFDSRSDFPVLILLLRQGDSLVTKCMYDTSGHNDTVFGGEETSNEMCLNFLGYYPNAATEEYPNFLSACLSVLNGIKSPNPAFDNIRVAVTGNDESTQSFILDFDEDPSTSWAECCDAGNCDDIYMASKGEACAQDSDCEGALICNGGLCEEATIEDENANGAQDPSSSPSNDRFLITATAAAAAMVLLCLY